jgi:hypothetical protein
MYVIGFLKVAKKNPSSQNSATYEKVRMVAMSLQNISFQYTLRVPSLVKRLRLAEFNVLKPENY